MIDCFDGMVVSWSIGTSPDAELVNTMLDVAIETVTESEEKPIGHSDRGGHYRWPSWLARVGEAHAVTALANDDFVRVFALVDLAALAQEALKHFGQASLIYAGGNARVASGKSA